MAQDDVDREQKAIVEGNKSRALARVTWTAEDGSPRFALVERADAAARAKELGPTAKIEQGVMKGFSFDRER